MRTIDADALVPDFLAPTYTNREPCKEYVSMEQIHDAPTIEAEPRKGKWIYEAQDRLEDETDDGQIITRAKRWKCSECGYDKGFALYKPKDKFCVECGADMRGEDA